MSESMHGYRHATFKQGMVAGLIVSTMALPLSMALFIAVGLPPQNGHYTAIVPGFAATFIVIAAPIVARYDLHGII